MNPSLRRAQFPTVRWWVRVTCAAAFVGCTQNETVADVPPSDVTFDAQATADSAPLRDDSPLIDRPDQDAAEHADAGEPLDAIHDVVGDTAHVHSRVSSHGMLITGGGTHVFLSHLPAFSEPHRVQVIVEGRFDQPPAAIPSDLSSEIHSMLPSPFSLDGLRFGAVSRITGTVFRGNHEQGGTMLAPNVTFLVSSVIYQAELTGVGDSSQGYIVFGQPDSLFAAHRIVAEPGYDHLLRVDVTPALPLADLAAGSVLLTRVQEDVVAFRLQAATMFTAPNGMRHTVTPVRTLSCLQGPGFGPACP